MRRFAATVMLAVLCATFSFAGFHDHVSNDPLHPEPCSACAFASVDSAPAAGPLAFEHAPDVERGNAETPVPATGSRALDRSASRAPPACC